MVRNNDQVCGNQWSLGPAWTAPNASRALFPAVLKKTSLMTTSKIHTISYSWSDCVPAYASIVIVILRHLQKAARKGLGYLLPSHWEPIGSCLAQILIPLQLPATASWLYFILKLLVCRLCRSRIVQSFMNFPALRSPK